VAAVRPVSNCGRYQYRRVASVYGSEEYRRCKHCHHTETIPEEEYLYVGVDDESPLRTVLVGAALALALLVGLALVFGPL